MFVRCNGYNVLNQCPCVATAKIFLISIRYILFLVLGRKPILSFFFQSSPVCYLPPLGLLLFDPMEPWSSSHIFYL